MVKAGKFDRETLTDRNRRLSAAVAQAENAWSDGNKAKIERAGRKLARLKFRLWGIEPWKTMTMVLAGKAAVKVKADIDHDNARENQQRENREHAKEAYQKELERIRAMQRYGVEPEGDLGYDYLRNRAKEALDKALEGDKA